MPQRPATTSIANALEPFAAIVSDRGMARYFFDVQDGASYPDKYGAVFYDLEAVRSEALKRSVGMLAGHHDEFWKGNAWKMTVSDERRNVLFTLNFMAVNSPLTENYGRRLSSE